MAGRRAGRYTRHQSDADSRRNQRSSPVALGRALAGAPHRAATAHRPPHAGQVPEHAGGAAVARAHAAGAFGADYVANILRQQQTQRTVQPPLRFQDTELNELATDPLSLADYDALILPPKKDEP